jgi:hypothetical protein
LSTRLATGAAGLAAAVLVASLPASGCGYCDEDRVAAVYDHGVITRALERRHQVAFLAIEGTLPEARRARSVIANALKGAQGIDAQSLRFSVEAASISISYDGERTSPARIAEILNREFAARGLRVSLLQAVNPR